MHVAIRRVLDFLLSISEREIRWPNDEEAARNKRAFRALGRCDGVEAGLPDVIGAIDGCHVRITRPTVCEEDYYNRKKFHSIILPDVCDADMMSLMYSFAFQAEHTTPGCWRRVFYSKRQLRDTTVNE